VKRGRWARKSRSVVGLEPLKRPRERTPCIRAPAERRPGRSSRVIADSGVPSSSCLEK
jgi:hypothetical protein